MIISRDNWKAKLKSNQLKVKQLKAKISRIGKAKGHHYSTWLVGLSVLLRIKCGCSYAGIRKILGILNELFQLGLKKVPCPNTIQNWVSKMGLYFMENLEDQLVGKQVSLIPVSYTHLTLPTTPYV